MDPIDIVSTTGEAAFAVDDKGSIIVWNRAAESLLGYAADQVLGKRCFEIVCGKDIFGNLFCDPGCNPRKMIRRRQPVRRFLLDLRDSSAERIRAAVTVVGFPGLESSDFTLLHLIQPFDRARKAEDPAVQAAIRLEGKSPASADAADPSRRTLGLTTREMEVLRMVAAGSSNREIGEALFISVATVRTHIEHILKKLQVHSKLQAVSLAHRRRILL